MEAGHVPEADVWGIAGQESKNGQGASTRVYLKPSPLTMARMCSYKSPDLLRTGRLNKCHEVILRVKSKTYHPPRQQLWEVSVSSLHTGVSPSSQKWYGYFPDIRICAHPSSGWHSVLSWVAISPLPHFCIKYSYLLSPSCTQGCVSQNTASDVRLLIQC